MVIPEKVRALIRKGVLFAPLPQFLQGLRDQGKHSIERCLKAYSEIWPFGLINDRGGPDDVFCLHTCPPYAAQLSLLSCHFRVMVYSPWHTGVDIGGDASL